LRAIGDCGELQQFSPSLLSLMPTTDNPTRLDTWLWAARFFKTRALAAAAVLAGRVELNDQKPKRGKFLKPGDHLTLCRKVMGRKPGDPLERLAEIEVVDVRRERLDALSVQDIRREGVPASGCSGARRRLSSSAG